ARNLAQGKMGREAARRPVERSGVVLVQTVGLFVVDKAVLPCLRQEGEFAGGQHAAGKAPDQGRGLDVKVLEHGVGLPPAQEADLHRRSTAIDLTGLTMVRGESLKGLGEGRARLRVRVPKAQGPEKGGLPAPSATNLLKPSNVGPPCGLGRSRGNHHLPTGQHGQKGGHIPHPSCTNNSYGRAVGVTAATGNARPSN
ncbi:hypothetical protein THAOC_01265, partial [Thalassiosira oceanica]